jgi:hypothetical protein
MLPGGSWFHDLLSQGVLLIAVRCGGLIVVYRGGLSMAWMDESILSGDRAGHESPSLF